LNVENFDNLLKNKNKRINQNSPHQGIAPPGGLQNLNPNPIQVFNFSLSLTKTIDFIWYVKKNIAARRKKYHNHRIDLATSDQ